ncbi:nucleoside monophosphate kinase [Candidatus Saccharibacteria bacterium]|nr:nucleoside monophosphate kinase [Candidatus Saccharibacteria bacterium]
MEEKISTIKEWLGAGSINIFGMPMSGKDTVGVRLAEDLDGEFLSSGLLIRAIERSENKDLTASGKLIPTEDFYDIVLPYFKREDIKKSPLILSSVGRWAGEEDTILAATKDAGHTIKAVVFLDLDEAEVMRRWHVAQNLGDRGERPDDQNIEVFKTRIEEFNAKTLPVIKHYEQLGLLLTIQADASRDKVYEAVVEALFNRALASQ